MARPAAPVDRNRARRYHDAMWRFQLSPKWLKVQPSSTKYADASSDYDYDYDYYD